MKAMVLSKLYQLRQNPNPLELRELPIPEVQSKQVLLKISVCGVCHTELDEIEGRTPPQNLPVILGHQVVGTIVQTGDKASLHKVGDRVGVAWIYSSCGRCKHCLSGNENLCPTFKATGRDVNGGYAEYMTVPEEFVYPIPVDIESAHAAPFLCAGAIGYRSLRLTGLNNGQRLGLTGFGASGHLVLKMAQYRYPNTEIYVFARSKQEQSFALELGATWAGNTTERSPYKLDCIIDTTPTWEPVVEALSNLDAGGKLVVNAIRKESDIHNLLKLDYPKHLWMEKTIKSVANITRQDVIEFLALAAEMKLMPEIQLFPLELANQALMELKMGKIRGAKVLVIED